MKFLKAIAFIIILSFVSPALSNAQWIDKQDGYKDPDKKIEKIPDNQGKLKKSKHGRVPVKRSKRKPDPKLPPKNASQIKLENESFNFGSIPQPCFVKHMFGVSNVGPDTLIISKIRPG
ncbi:MAG: DUF1573 domain-containing protein [candidate division Zixibacteria bacterium]|nr:DUF1573 domain-containing protein [candidate division Zixibacteria bacterium]